MKKTILTLISPRITPGSTTCSLLRTFSPHDRAVARGGDGQVQAGDLDALAAVVLDDALQGVVAVVARRRKGRKLTRMRSTT